MSEWYRKVSSDLRNLPNAITYYEAELKMAQKDLMVKGETLEMKGAQLPLIFEVRFSQLQETEAILELLNIEHRRIKTRVFRKYVEKYDRSLSSRDAEKFADGDPEVVDMALLINEFALVRNKYLALLKGLDAKNWMISNITKLKCAGLEDTMIS